MPLEETQIKQILKLKEKGYGRYRISRETGISERRVRAVLEKNSGNSEMLIELRTERTLKELTMITGKSERVCLAEIEDLKDKGYNIIELNGKYFLSKLKGPENNQHKLNWNGATHIRFGVVSDTHMGSTYEQNTFLNYLYDYFQSEGVTQVFHCGDVSDGYYTNRQDQIYLLHKFGEEQQAEHIAEKYPKRDGMTTFFITGNHDYTHMRNGGANIGKHISRLRDDMVYLGSDRAVIQITPNFKIELRHPGDGNAYADSYKLQKLIEAIAGGDKPNAVFVGHYHKYNVTFYRNVFGFLVPSVQWQTPFMLGKNLRAEVGGIMVEMWVDETGTIKRLRHELIPLFKQKEEDY